MVFEKVHWNNSSFFKYFFPIPFLDYQLKMSQNGRLLWASWNLLTRLVDTFTVLSHYPHNRLLKAKHRDSSQTKQTVSVLIQSTESAALLKWKCQQLKTKNSKKCSGTVYTRCVQMSANSKTAGAAAKLISIACSRKNSSVTRNSGNQGFHLCQSSSLKREKEMKSSCRKKEEPDVCF